MDAEAVATALAEAGLLPAGAPVGSVAPLAGGVSNLTLRVELADGAVVVRVQRQRGIFEPYDVVREARVLEALGSTPVPVPGVRAVRAESAALGAPFFVMEFVDAPHMGRVARSARVIERYIAAVAAIHAVGWREAGLGFLAPPDGQPPAAYDLNLVRARAAAHGCADETFIAELDGWLAAHPPAAATPALCQGDINVFNYLFQDEAVVAVVDWEQAQIGDRLSDLGLLAALSYLTGAQGPPAALPLIRDYAAHTGASLGALPYFVLAALHKLAVIHRIWSAEAGEPPWFAWEAILRSAARLRAEAASA